MLNVLKVRMFDNGVRLGINLPEFGFGFGFDFGLDLILNRSDL